MQFTEMLANLLPSASGDIVLAVQLFVALMVGHMVGDFPLQGQFLALGKTRRYWKDGEGAGLSDFGPCTWVYCLSAHSIIHLGIVWLITGCFWFGIVEGILHWIIDWIKGEGRISFFTDQLLHTFCKLAYAVAAFYGIGVVAAAI